MLIIFKHMVSSHVLLFKFIHERQRRTTGLLLAQPTSDEKFNTAEGAAWPSATGVPFDVRTRQVITSLPLLSGSIPRRLAPPFATAQDRTAAISEKFTPSSSNTFQARQD
jgi:hypothetical protein